MKRFNGLVHWYDQLKDLSGTKIQAKAGDLPLQPCQVQPPAEPVVAKEYSYSPPQAKDYPISPPQAKDYLRSPYQANLEETQTQEPVLSLPVPRTSLRPRNQSLNHQKTPKWLNEEP